MTSKVKVAVLGVGSLGKEHARIYAELAAAGLVEFAGIFDANADTARKIAAKHNTRVFNSVAEAASPMPTHSTLSRRPLPILNWQKHFCRRANTSWSKNR